MAKNVDIVERFDAGNKISTAFTNRVTSTLGSGKWYQVTSGLDATIHPEFYNDDNSGVYWPGYQLANSYVAYNTANRSGLAYLAEVDKDPVQSKETNAVAIQRGNLNGIILGLYQNITWSPSKRQSKIIADGENFLEPMAQYVAAELKEYAFQSGELNDIQRFTGFDVFDQPIAQRSINKINEWLTHQGVQHANLWKGDMYDIWNYYFADPENPGVWDSDVATENNVIEFKSLVSKFLDNGFVGEDLTTTGIKANMNLGRYGPQRMNRNGRLSRPPFENPWTERLYNIYFNDESNITINGTTETVYGTMNDRNQEYIAVTAIKKGELAELDYMKTYLANYQAFLDIPNSTGAQKRRTKSRVTDRRFVDVVQGLASAPEYALKFDFSPAANSNTKIEFGLQTSGSHTTNKTKINTTEVEWKAKSSYQSGWGFGGTITNEGVDKNRRQWGSFEKNASDLKVNQTWEGVTTRSVNPSREWFRPEIINEAWNNPTADTPTKTGGFKFMSPEAKNRYANGSIYYIDGIAYADSFRAKIEGKTEYTKKEFQDKLREFQQTTKAKAGYSWGGFSIGGETSFSTSENSRESSDTSNVENGGFIINHDPIGKAKALKNGDGKKITGDPKSLIAVSLKKIGLAPGVVESGGASARSQRGREVCIDKRGFAKADPASKSTKDEPFTLVGKVTFFGTDKNRREYIRGDDYPQTIYGLDGKENIIAGGGDDIIYPGSGLSHVKGGTGSDLIVFRRDSYTDGGRNFTFVKDWKLSDNDRLAFNGYLKDQVFITASPITNKKDRVNLYLHGIAVAQFRDISLEDMQQIIDNAHFSVAPTIAPTLF